MYYLTTRDIITSILETIVVTILLCINYYISFEVFNSLTNIISFNTGLPMSVHMFITLSFIESTIYLSTKKELGN